MAAGEGCQAATPSVRSCGPSTSPDTVLAVPGPAAPLDSSLVPTAWVASPLPLVVLSQHQVAPLVSRSPPSLSA